MKILPRTDPLSDGYWDAAAQHRLAAQRCCSCSRLHHPPVARCPQCHGSTFDWQTMNGTGTVYTFTVVHHSVHPVTADSMPYVLAVVELDEGPRILTNLRDIEPSDVRIGLPVAVTFEDLADGVSLPQFRPVNHSIG